MPEDFTVNSVEFGAKAIPETKRLHGKVFGWQFQDGGRDCERFDGAGIDGGFHAVDHFFKRNNGFVGAVAAAFLRHLVFEMHGGHAGFFHGFDGAGDIECAAPTGVDIDQKRGVDIIGDALCVD